MPTPSAAAVGMQGYQALSVGQPHLARQAVRDAHGEYPTADTAPPSHSIGSHGLSDHPIRL